MRDHGSWIELPAQEKSAHLVPGLVHLAADDAVHGDPLEDDLIGEIDRDFPVRNAEQLHPPAQPHRRECLVQRRRHTRHLAHHVRAFLGSLGEDRLYDVVPLCVDGDVRAHFLRERETLGIHIGRNDLGGARRARDADRETADRPASDNENGAAGNLCGQHRVERVPHRVHDRADFGGDVSPVERQHIGRGHHDVLRKRPVAIDADDARVLADVAVAGAALEAVPADDVTLGGDEVARAESRDAVTDRLDLPGKFVAHDDRRLDAALGPWVPVGDVEVGAADPGVPNGDQDFTRTGGWLGDGRNLQARAAAGLHNGLHVRSGCGMREAGCVRRWIA